MGVALRDLKNQGFLIIGSGASVHGGFFQPEGTPRSLQFDDQLAKICLSELSDDALLN